MSAAFEICPRLADFPPALGAAQREASGTWCTRRSLDPAARLASAQLLPILLVHSSNGRLQAGYRVRLNAVIELRLNVAIELRLRRNERGD